MGRNVEYNYIGSQIVNYYTYDHDSGVDNIPVFDEGFYLHDEKTIRFDFDINTTFVEDTFIHKVEKRGYKTIPTTITKRIWWTLWLFKKEVCEYKRKCTSYKLIGRYNGIKLSFNGKEYKYLLSKIEEDNEPTNS